MPALRSLGDLLSCFPRSFTPVSERPERSARFRVSKAKPRISDDVILEICRFLTYPDRVALMGAGRRTRAVLESDYETHRAQRINQSFSDPLVFRNMIEERVASGTREITKETIDNLVGQLKDVSGFLRGRNDRVPADVWFIMSPFAPQKLQHQLPELFLKVMEIPLFPKGHNRESSKDPNSHKQHEPSSR